MRSTSEAGHAKNVANFAQLVSFCEGYGTAYNPSRSELNVASLQAALTQAQAVLNDLNNAKASFDVATNLRREAFSTLPKFAGQVVNALAAAGVSTMTIADARGLLRKLQGKRAVTPKPAAEPTPPVTPTTEDKQISVSQLSFNSLIEHFSKLVTIAAQQKLYNPNKKEFTIAGLQQKLDDLNNANAAVVKSYTNLSNARLTRNNFLYNPVTGLNQAAAGVKLYVKSIFGATSPQYKQLSGISFTSAK